MTLLQSGIAKPSSSGYSIDQSLRFEPDEHYLSRAYSSAGNRRTWTVSFWHKVDNLASSRQLFGVSTNATVGNPWPGFIVSIDPTGTSGISIEEYTGSSYNLLRQTANLFRDPSAWYHFVIRYDTTQATDSNRIKIYVNGVEVEYNGSPTYPSQNHEGYFNDTNTHRIGKGGSSNGDGAGYFAEFYSIDGQSLGPASFGETNSATNQWVPVEYSGSYGTQGWYLPFSSTELANSFTDGAKLAIDSSDRESEIAVTSSFTWLFTSSGNTDGEDLVNGLVTNNDAGGGWMPSGSVTDRWIKFDFGSGKVYTKCQWISINSTGSEGTWKWQGSNNDADWTDIGGTFTLGGADGGSNVTYTLGDTLSGNTTSYRYYRILGTTGSANTSGRRLAMYFGGWSSGVGKTITANGDVTNTRAQSKIGDSSIYFDGTGDYLSTASSGMGLTGDYTIECWFNTASSTSDNGIISNKYNNSSFNGNFSLRLNDGGNSNDIAFRPYNGTVAEGGLVTSGTGAWSDNTWTHVAVVRSGSGTGNVKMYINGSLAGTSSGASSSTILGNAGDLNIGRQESASAGTNYLNGYMDEIRISSSARYTGTFTPSTTAFTADANTLLLIHSDFNGGLGADSSGNKNDFTPTNLVATDQVLDSPTRNYCTLNPLDAFNSMTATEGNLRANTNSGSDPKINATFQIPQSGKWYWEFVDQHGLSIMVGVIDQTNSGNVYGNNNSVIYSSGLGTKYNFSSVSSYGASWTTGDIIGVAINRDDNEITFYKNNSSQGTFTIGGTAAQRARLIPVIGTGTGGTGGGTFNFGQDSSFHGTKTAQGNGDDGEDFFYTPPTGYKALNSFNLDDPAIALPGDYFNTIAYQGDGTSLSVTGVGFQPDLVWIKNRTGTYATRDHKLFNVINGATNFLESNTTDAEASFGTGVSFDSDGFTLNGDYGINPPSGTTTVSWSWKAGGTAVSNGDGSVPTSVSANPAAGFSIVSYTGTGSSATFGHGLSQAPQISFYKVRSEAYQWMVYTGNILSSTGLILNGTDAGYSPGGTYGTHGASTFNLLTNADVNGSTKTYISYHFHSVEGYSKIGKYTGNSSADGPMFYCGFKPAWAMFKATGSAQSWTIFDNKRNVFNLMDNSLFPNLSDAENDATSLSVDFVSNGIKIRSTHNYVNYSGSDYIVLAFAELPFKTSNAR